MRTGEKVVLNDELKRIVDDPDKYGIGEITKVGSWGIVYVKWEGIDDPIGMREDELEAKK